MKAASRLGLAMAAAGLALAPVPAFAQGAPAATNTRAADAIGPRELQNFSLGGTVTRPADTPAPAPSAPPQSRARTPSATSTGPQTSTSTARDTSPRQRRPAAQVARTAAAPEASPPSANAGSPVALDAPAAATPVSAPEPGFASQSDSSVPSLAPEQEANRWPWLLLAAVLGAGAAVLLWRRRSNEAFAGADHETYVAPEPQPAPWPTPRAAPPAPTPAPPKPAGIVSSRLRPWVDIAFAPIGCTVDDERVVVEFEIQLTNSGSAPARDILVEASMFNAGATQEQDIGAFFAHPVGQGERIQVIAPLQHVSIRTSLVAPRQNIQVFEMAGRKVFVPLVAFNALYRQSGGPAQTSAAYLLGRDTKGEKLGPFRADGGPSAFASLGSRSLPIGVRT